MAVTGFGTLELAGSVSALAAGTTRADVTNNSSATAGILVSGTNQVVGAIDGNGTTQVDAGRDFTANSIIQSALPIGGTPGSPALVKIAASGASGEPLSQSMAQSSELVSFGLPPPGELSAGLVLNGGPPPDDQIALGDSLGRPIRGAGTAAVPEPQSVVLIALGGLVALLQAFCRRQYPIWRADFSPTIQETSP